MRRLMCLAGILAAVVACTPGGPPGGTEPQEGGLKATDIDDGSVLFTLPFPPGTPYAQEVRSVWRPISETNWQEMPEAVVGYAVPPGTTLWAPAPGKVVMTVSQDEASIVDMEFAEGVMVRFRLWKGELSVPSGATVARGQTLGTVGEAFPVAQSPEGVLAPQAEPLTGVNLSLVMAKEGEYIRVSDPQRWAGGSPHFFRP